MPYGLLPTPLDGRHGPISNPVIDPEIPHFTHAHSLAARYYSDYASVAPLIPDCFELDERPIVTIRIYNYGMSRLGQYRELMLFVEVTYQGKRYDYVPYLYVTNEAALVAGREPLGFPKLIANIDFSPMRETSSPLISAHLYRPAEVPLMYGVFRPLKYAGRVEEHPELADQLPAIALRSLPGSPRPISELVAAQMDLIAGDIWPCKGKFALTGFSDIDDLHHFPMIESIDAYLFTDATFTLKLGSAERFNLQK